MTSVFVGGSCSPTINHCTITGNMGGCGLVVAEEASGHYTNNVISNHLPFCLMVSTRGSPVFENNDITQSLKAIGHMSMGATIIHGGTVLITREGAETDRPIAPTFTNNHIRDDVLSVVVAQQSSDLAALNSYDPELDKKIFAERVTVRVDSTCSPTFIDNNISGGNVGLSVFSGAGGTYTSNNISLASLYGITLSCWSAPLLRFNTVSKCATGIFAEGTLATLSQNIVRECTGVGLLLLCGVEEGLRLENNTFVGNEVGISLRPVCRSRDASMNISTIRLQSFSEKERRRMADALAAQLLRDRKVEATATTSAPPGDAAATPVNEEAEKLPAAIRHAVLVKNTVSHNRLCGVTAIGSGCTAIVEDLAIISNGLYGVLCTLGATPVFRCCNFEGGTVGFVSEKTARPVVTKCKFVQQSEACMVVRDRGLAEFNSNVLSSFGRIGICVDDGGNPLVDGNMIGQSGGVGVQVTTGGMGTFFNNHFESVGHGAIVTTYGDPLFCGNEFSNCTEMAVFIREEGIGVFTDNVFKGCSIGFGVSTGGEPTLRGNDIVGSVRVGIVLSEGSRALVEKNEIEDSVGGGLLFEGVDSISCVIKNHVRNNGGFGMRSIKKAQGSAIRNHMEGNLGGGIGSEDEGATTFSRNTCYSERGAGIRVGQGGKGIFHSNRCEAGNASGLELLAASDAHVDRCIFTRNRDFGVKVYPGAGGVVSKCELTNNSKGGVHYFGDKCHSTVLFDELVVRSNEGYGIAIGKDGTGQLCKCVIENHPVGVYLHQAGAACIEDCLLKNNDVGVQFTKGGCAIVKKCNISGSKTADVEISQEGAGTVEACMLCDSEKYGVLSTSNSAGTVTGCTIDGAKVAGVYIKGGSTTSFVSNQILRSNIGALCDEGSRGHLMKNDICRCHSVGAHILHGSEVRFEENNVKESAQIGVLIEATAGLVRANVISQSGTDGVVLVNPLASQLRAEEAALAIGQGQSKLPTRNPSKPSAPSSDYSGVALAENEIRESKGSGLVVTAHCKGAISKNRIRLNAKSGAIVMSGASPAIFGGNVISDNRGGGVVLEELSAAEVRENELARNAPCNLLLCKGSLGHVERNEIWGGAPNGVHCEGSSTVLTENMIGKNYDGSGVLVIGANKRLRMEGNQIANNNIGISCAGTGSSAKILKNHIYGNTLCGIRFAEDCALMVEGNNIEKGSLGIWLVAGGDGAVTKNDIRGNREGVLFQGDTIRTTCSDNIIEANLYGVVFRHCREYALTGNSFGANDEAAVLLEETSESAILENKFVAGNRGVLVTGCCNPKVIGNEFNGCVTGLEVTQQAACEISRNYFLHCGKGANISSNGAATTCTANTFAECLVAGLCCEGAACPSAVAHNLFAACNAESACGVLLKNGGGGVICENDFHLNTIGVRSEQDAAGDVVRCMFHHNGACGVSAASKATTVFSGCAFAENGTADVLCADSAAITVRSCAFRSSPIGVLLQSQSRGNFTANQFRECATAIVVEGADNPSVANNSISGSRTAVVFRVAASPLATVSNNLISQCEAGCLLTSGGSGTFSSNYVTHCDVGVVVEKQGGGVVSNNTLTKSAKCGVLVKGVAGATLSNNVISDNGNSGVHVAVPVSSAPATERVSFVENNIAYNRTNVVAASGDFALRRNHIHKGDSGLLISPDVGCEMEGNVIYDNLRFGCALQSRRCRLSCNEFYCQNDDGALELPPEGGIIVPRDNGVFNHCTSKVAPPPTRAPAKPADVATSCVTKDVAAVLIQLLLPMHQQELLDTPYRGCSLIPLSTERVAVPPVAVDADEETPQSRGGKRPTLRLSVSVLTPATPMFGKSPSKDVRSGRLSSASPAMLPKPPAAPPTPSTRNSKQAKNYSARVRNARR